jgi:hypothetical protein
MPRVRHIQTKEIGSNIHQVTDDFLSLGGWPKRGQDSRLPSFLHGWMLLNWQSAGEVIQNLMPASCLQGDKYNQM